MASSRRAEISRSAGSSLSTSVMARARVTRSPFRTPSMYRSSGSLLGFAAATSAESDTNSVHQSSQNRLRAIRNPAPRPENSGDPGLAQPGIIPGRDHAAGKYENIAAAEPPQLAKHT